MGGWLGGQAEYVTVPYADWNLLRFPDRDLALAKIRDLAMLSDIFPTGYHGAYTGSVASGRRVACRGRCQPRDQTAKASSSNATATRRLASSSTASS
jgi:hypothetical protein